MPEANSAPILSRPSTRYPGFAPALAPKPKLLDHLHQRDLAAGWSRVQMPHALSLVRETRGGSRAGEAGRWPEQK
jgi:hypothetical protein